MDTSSYATNLLSAFAIGQAGGSQTDVADAIADAGKTFNQTQVITTAVTGVCPSGGGPLTAGIGSGSAS